MKVRLTSIILILSSLSLFAQDIENMDSTQRAEMELMMKEMQMRKKHYQPEKLEDFTAYFQPALIDSIFDFIQNERYSELYNRASDLLQKAQPKEDILKYFHELVDIYGRIIEYNDDIYYIKNQMGTHRKVASGSYDVVFEKAKGKIILDLVVIDSMDIKLQRFQVETEDYTPFAKFDEIAETTFQYLVNKEYPALYNSTTKRFQDYTPIAKFEEFVEKLDTVDFIDHKLYQNQIGVINNKTIYYIIYDIVKSNGLLTLTFVESDKTYLLEGLNYRPKE